MSTPPTRDAHSLKENSFFDNAQKRSDLIPPSIIQIIVGDLNTRFQARREHEVNQLGRFTFGRGSHFLEACESRHAEPSNRELCMEWLTSSKLRVNNTFFKKTNLKKATYRDIGTEPGERNILPDKFAEIDFCITPIRWSNMIIDVEIDRKRFFHLTTTH